MRLNRSRRSFGAVLLPLCSTLLLLALAATGAARAQTSANAPASVPAGAEEPVASKVSGQLSTTAPAISSKQAREAEDAFIEGAKQVDRKDLAAAEKSFERAVQLNPNNRDYALALIVVREHRLSELVQQAANARLLGENSHADALLEEARKLDPNNAVIAQHFGTDAVDAVGLKGDAVANSLSGAVKLDPKPGKQDVHLRGAPRDVLQSLYSQFGIAVSFDSSVNAFSPVKLDLEGVTFDQAKRIAGEMTGTFAIPVQPHTAMIAADTQENRDRLQPQVQETLYMPGLQESQMQEMANLARNVFNLKSVTASPSTDTIVLRGDPDNLKVLNATYDSMLNGGTDIVLDVKLYEVDRTNTRNIGLQLPTSVGIFSVAAEAEQLVSANQSIIQQAVAAGVIKLSGNSFTDLITEVGFLIGSGVVSASQYTNLLGIFGNGLTLAGVYVGSGSTVNLLLNSSDIRMLDAVQLRSGNSQDATFRAGTRYPITTSTYTTGVSSSIASAVAGLSVNGTSVSSLLQQYLGSSSVTVPQIQYENLGLTLKATPVVLRSGIVQLKLDLKIESLGGTSLNNIPILNNRELTSVVTVPAGQTALMASEVSKTETNAVQGIPGLSELPGFQSTTNENKETSTGELLITVTPHVVRENGLRIASRPLLLPYNPHPNTETFYEEPPPAPPQAPQTPQNQQTPQNEPPMTGVPGRQMTAPATGTTPEQPTTPQQ
ncbi:MAG TPA: type II secretory protein PulD [Acidobacteriaceae bacterium]|jgi:type II secretory pathway component GspD/PulD (secretin)